MANISWHVRLDESNRNYFWRIVQCLLRIPSACMVFALRAICERSCLALQLEINRVSRVSINCNRSSISWNAGSQPGCNLDVVSSGAGPRTDFRSLRRQLVTTSTYGGSDGSLPQQDLMRRTRRSGRNEAVQPTTHLRGWAICAGDWANTQPTD